jgi:hypothetical protein
MSSRHDIVSELKEMHLLVPCVAIAGSRCPLCEAITEITTLRGQVAHLVAPHVVPPAQLRGGRQ